MKPTFVFHDSYQNFVLTQLKEHYSHGILTLVSKDCLLSLSYGLLISLMLPLGLVILIL